MSETTIIYLLSAALFVAICFIAMVVRGIARKRFLDKIRRSQHNFYHTKHYTRISNKMAKTYNNHPTYTPQY